MKVLAFDLETKDPYIKKAPSGAPYADSKILCACGAFYDTEKPDNRETFSYSTDYMKAIQEIEKADFIVGANIQYDLDYLSKKMKHTLREDQQIVDVLVSERLLDTVSRKMNLNTVAQKYAGESKGTNSLEAYAEEHGIKKYMENLDLMPIDRVMKYCLTDCYLTLEVFIQQHDQLKNFAPYYVEMDIQKVLYNMRREGVHYDTEFSECLEKEMDESLLALEKELLSEFKARKFTTYAEKDKLSAYCDERNIKYTKTTKTKRAQFNAAFFNRNKDNLDLQKIQTHKTTLKLKKDFVTKTRNLVVGGKLFANLNPMKSEEGGTVTGRFSCVTGDTLILSNRGNISILDLKTGDKVLTHKGSWQPVTDKFYQGIQDVFRIFLNNGDVLDCTKSHKMLESDGKWSSLEQIIQKGIENVSLKNASKRQKNSATSANSLQRKPTDDHKASGSFSRHNLAYRKGDIGNKLASRRIQTSKKNKAVCFKNRRQKSYEGQVSDTASLLERSCVRQERILNNKNRRRKNVSTQKSYGRFSRAKKTAFFSYSPSYRRRPFKQRYTQLSFVHKERAQNDSFSTSTRNRELKITKINYIGRHKTYDIEVAKDHSYITAGIFSHNCTKPNLQQIPSRDKVWAPLIRSQFSVPKGYKFIKMDYSQQEVRMMLHFASENNDEKALEMIQRYKEDPKTDSYNIIKELLDRSNVVLERSVVKQLVLAYQYCMGAEKLADQLLIQDDEAKALLLQFGKKLPFINAFKYSVLNTLSRMARNQKEAYIETIAGRKIFFEIETIERQVGRGKIFDRQAVKAYRGINYKVQGSCSDVAKKAMVSIYNKYKIVPVLMVHDELDWIIREDLVEDLVPKLQYEMENTYPLRIPMTVDVDIYDNWGGVDYETRNKILSKHRQAYAQKTFDFKV